MLPGLRNFEAENCEAEFVFNVDVFRCDKSLFLQPIPVLF